MPTDRAQEMCRRSMRVDCTQFAACGWHGWRLVEKLGVQPKPCPKCGKAVAA